MGGIHTAVTGRPLGVGHTAQVGSINTRLPVVEADPAAVPHAPFTRLTSLWIQLTGTWCNLECTHCLNASGPKEPWLRPLAAATARQAIAEAARLGVKEIYFTGGEPFLHGAILPLLAASLAVAPTTVLTNGTLVTAEIADALRGLAEASPYSLEIRVSLDDADPVANDRVRGRGAWAQAVGAIRRLDERGLLPIVTATEIARDEAAPAGTTYQRLRDFLLAQGIAKPRVKIMPVFGLGRRPVVGARLTDEALEGFDRATLQCAETRVVADGGVYACPILAGLAGARLSTGHLAEAFRPAPLFHPACATCHQTGMTCGNA